MIFNNYEAAFYTVLLLVPGFIMNMGYAYLVPVREGQAQLVLVRYVVFSCFLYALIWPFVGPLYKLNYWISHPFRWSLILILILIVLPYTLGLLIGLINGRNWIRAILRRVGINPIHPAPTAWDYVMVRDSGYVVVTLKNGNHIFGLFAENSMASSVSAEKDIYLEKMYKIDEEDNWQLIERDQGVWINGSEILHIEFRSVNEEEEENGEQTQ